MLPLYLPLPLLPLPLLSLPLLPLPLSLSLPLSCPQALLTPHNQLSCRRRLLFRNLLHLTCPLLRHLSSPTLALLLHTLCRCSCPRPYAYVYPYTS